MAEWQPLSVRRGLRVEEGPYEGVPPHLSVFLQNWFGSSLDQLQGDRSHSIEEAIAMRFAIATDNRHSLVGQILMACRVDEDLFLDAIEMVLWFDDGRCARDLETKLSLSGSVWTVDDETKLLVRRVSESELETYEPAVNPADEISTELSTAWGKVYGRNPDPSDAWDHAIKAVELSLWSIVTPDNKKATLGTIIQALSRPAAPFALRLVTSSAQSTSLEALVQMLRLMWPHPDRHGTGDTRVPTHEEATNVVQLAVLVVGWARSGALTGNSQ